MDDYDGVNTLLKPGAYVISSRLMMNILNAFQIKASIDKLDTSDVEILARLIVLLNKKRSTIEETPPVYWYTRQGR